MYVEARSGSADSYALIVILCKLYEIDWNIERVRRKGDGRWGEEVDKG